MSRTGENIYKRKDGRWEGRYIKERIEGKTKYGAVYARSYREVKQKLEAVKQNLDKFPSSGTDSAKLEEIGRQWLSEAAVTLKKSSINKYEDILRCYILPEFGENRLSEITNQDLTDFVNGLLLSGGVNSQGLKPATVAEILSAMNGIRVYAMKRDYAVAFSAECIRLKREKKEIRVFSLEEERQLLGHLRENMDRTALGVLLCLFTGIRVGELCALRWDDIDIGAKLMHISRTMQRVRTDGTDSKTEIRIFAPKSSSSVRTIPLPDIIMGNLEKFYVSGAFVLTGDGSRYMEPRTMQNRFKRLLVSCGIRDANFHATRHTFATRCIELGFDVKSLSEVLGHANVAITMNRYVHPSMDHKTERVNRFSDLFAVG